jgi:hypothetical protein
MRKCSHVRCCFPTADAKAWIKIQSKIQEYTHGLSRWLRAHEVAFSQPIAQQAGE